MGAKEAISRKVFDSIIAEIKVGLENAQFKEEQSKNFTAKKEKKKQIGRSVYLKKLLIWNQSTTIIHFST